MRYTINIKENVQNIMEICKFHDVSIATSFFQGFQALWNSCCIKINKFSIFDIQCQFSSLRVPIQIDTSKFAVFSVNFP